MTGAEVFLIVAVIAAEARRRMVREEEEEATPMTADAGFEYKIIRSATADFKKPAKFRQILEAEADAGWELFEKLDDSRARLRRPVAYREKDAELDHDPYRTNVGVSEAALAVRILLGVLGGVIAVIALLGVLALILGK